MKRYAFALLALAALSVMAFGMLTSGAWFSATATTGDNTFAAGTLSLLINGQEDPTQTYSIANLAPGAWQLSGQAMLTNNGSLPGKLWFEIVNVRNRENGCGQPERKAGDATCGAGDDQGELGGLVKASFQANVAPWTRYGGSQVINASSGERVDVKDLAAGEAYPIVLYAVWPQGESDNLAQSDAVVFDVVFHLEQIHP